jgi:hypothetical protein
VRPEPQRPVAGLGHQGAGEVKPETAAAMRGMNHQLAGRTLGRVGRFQVRVSGQLAAAAQQQVACAGITPVAQMQHDMLGKRPHAILVGGGTDKLQHHRGLGVRDPVADA